MKKVLWILMTVLAAVTSAFAEDNAPAENRKLVIPVSFSFFPGISRPLNSDAEEEHWIKLSAIGAESDYLKGVALGGAIDITSKDVHGLQIAGGFNWAGRDMIGLQIGGGFNVAGSGLGTNNLTNFIPGRLAGMQIGGGFNFGCGDSEFFWSQISGGFNWHMGRMSGMQIAGGFNLAHQGDASGVQIAGGFNAAGANMSGVQIGGGANLVTGSMNGVQIAGGLNLADRLNGMQLGVVNAAWKVNGVQLGLVNISEEMNGIALGLFQLVKNGEFFIDITANDRTDLNFELRHGSKYFYNIYSWGVELGSIDLAGTKPMFRNLNGLGYGMKYDFEKNFALGVEGIFHMIQNSSDVIDMKLADGRMDPAQMKAIWERTFTYTEIRLFASVRLAEYLAVVGGVTYNIGNQTDANKDKLRAPSMGLLNWSTDSNPQWPGFFLGVRI